jgi:hypothetical protein
MDLHLSGEEFQTVIDYLEAIAKIVEQTFSLQEKFAQTVEEKQKWWKKLLVVMEKFTLLRL